MVSIAKPDTIHGLVHHVGAVHLINSCVRYAMTSLKKSHKAVLVVDQFVRLAIAYTQKSDAHAYFDKKVKPFSKTRYAKYIEAYHDVMFNLQDLYSIFDSNPKLRNNATWKAWCSKKKQMEFILSKLIAVTEVQYIQYIFLIFVS